MPPIGVGGRPFRPDADEARLWAEAEREERILREKTRAYDDPLLAGYLGRLGDGLVPEEVRAAGGPEFRFVVLADPTLNAFAMPNGRVYVHSGLLARLDNEAQLAMILGREIAHVDHRHALRWERDHGGRRGFATALRASVGLVTAAAGRAGSGVDRDAAILGPTARAILGGGLGLAALAAIDGYGGKLEREADREGMARMVRAGYDPREAPRAFRLLAAESAERGSLETFFLGNPAKLEERIETTSELLLVAYARASAAPSTLGDTDEFRRRTLSLVRENALLDIRAGRFGLAEGQLARVLAATPLDATAHLYLGDLYRLEAQHARNAEDRAARARKALGAYERSAELDRGLPDPYRELGFLYYREQEPEKAREAFRRYLALAPNAPDAWRIEAYLGELER